jgi:hypothetical protein
MTSILGIGCIIDRNEIVEKFEENKFMKQYLIAKNTNLNLRDEINEILYDDINEFLKDNELPFKFYTPYTQTKDDGKNYYLIYTLNKTDRTDIYESINLETLINDYQIIKQFFEKTLTLLFGKSNSNKFNLKIISNFSY